VANSEKAKDRKQNATGEKNGGTGGGGSGGGGKGADLVFDLARATAIWVGYFANAAKVGCETFANTLEAEKKPTEIGWNNGILQAAVRGWVKALETSYDSMPGALTAPLGEILVDGGAKARYTSSKK